ncbi:MAG: glycoside hydrolase family 5 protein [Ignavibacteria bacterium]
MNNNFFPTESDNETRNSTSIVDKFGKLSVSGNRVVNKNGEPVVLRGMSLFWSQIKGKYYNYDCVKWLRDDWKCTVVRASMGIEQADGLDGYLKNPQTEYDKAITVIDAAIGLGIYVIVDWHDHHAHNNKTEAIEFFKKIAETYGDEPNLIYEIYNEPMQVSWKDVVKPYSEEVIKVIREIDPDNLIVAGTTTWSQDVDIASNDPINYNNIAYSLHFYASSHKQDLRNKAEAALNNGAALFVTEFGTTEYTGDGYIDEAEVETWFSFMEENKISWCNWSIGDKDEASAALKPGTDAKGGWADSVLTQSGKILRTRIINANEHFFK